MNGQLCIVFCLTTSRDLPSPLLTREHLMTFASIADIEVLKEQVRSLNLLVLLLPEVNQRVLKVSRLVQGRHTCSIFSLSVYLWCVSG